MMEHKVAAAIVHVNKRASDICSDYGSIHSSVEGQSPNAGRWYFKEINERDTEDEVTFLCSMEYHSPVQVSATTRLTGWLFDIDECDPGFYDVVLGISLHGLKLECIESIAFTVESDDGVILAPSEIVSKHELKAMGQSKVGKSKWKMHQQLRINEGDSPKIIVMDIQPIAAKSSKFDPGFVELHFMELRAFQPEGYNDEKSLLIHRPFLWSIDLSQRDGPDHDNPFEQPMRIMDYSISGDGSHVATLANTKNHLILDLWSVIDPKESKQSNSRFNIGRKQKDSAPIQQPFHPKRCASIRIVLERLHEQQPRFFKVCVSWDASQVALTETSPTFLGMSEGYVHPQSAFAVYRYDREKENTSSSIKATTLKKSTDYQSCAGLENFYGFGKFHITATKRQDVRDQRFIACDGTSAQVYNAHQKWTLIRTIALEQPQGLLPPLHASWGLIKNLRGRYFAWTGQMGGTISVQDIEHGTKVTTFQSQHQGISDYVNAVPHCFSKDGYIVAIQLGSAVTTYSTLTGSELGSFFVPSQYDPVYALQFIRGDTQIMVKTKAIDEDFGQGQLGIILDAMSLTVVDMFFEPGVFVAQDYIENDSCPCLYAAHGSKLDLVRLMDRIIKPYPQQIVPLSSTRRFGNAITNEGSNDTSPSKGPLDTNANNDAAPQPTQPIQQVQPLLQEQPKMQSQEQPKMQPQEQPQVQPQAQPRSQPQLQSQPQAQPRSQPQSQPQPQPRPRSQPQSQPQPQPRPRSRPQSQPQVQPQAQTDSNGPTSSIREKAPTRPLPAPVDRAPIKPTESNPNRGNVTKTVADIDDGITKPKTGPFSDGANSNSKNDGHSANDTGDHTNTKNNDNSGTRNDTRNDTSNTTNNNRRSDNRTSNVTNKDTNTNTDNSTTNDTSRNTSNSTDNSTTKSTESATKNITNKTINNNTTVQALLADDNGSSKLKSNDNKTRNSINNTTTTTSQPKDAGETTARPTKASEDKPRPKSSNTTTIKVQPLAMEEKDTTPVTITGKNDKKNVSITVADTRPLSIGKKSAIKPAPRDHKGDTGATTDTKGTTKTDLDDHKGVTGTEVDKEGTTKRGLGDRKDIVTTTVNNADNTKTTVVVDVADKAKLSPNKETEIVSPRDKDNAIPGNNVDDRTRGSADSDLQRKKSVDDKVKPGTKPDTIKPNSTKDDAIKLEDNKPDAAKPEDNRPDATKPEDSKPDAAKPEDSKPENSKLGDINGGPDTKAEDKEVPIGKEGDSVDETRDEVKPTDSDENDDTLKVDNDSTEPGLPPLVVPRESNEPEEELTPKDLNVPIVVALVENKWNTTGYKYWQVRLACLCCYYLMVLSAVSTEHASHRGLYHAGLYLLIASSSSFFLWLELTPPPKDWRQHFSSIYNVVDVAVFSLPLAGSIGGLLLATSFGLFSLSTLFVALHLLFEFRPDERVCEFITITIKVVSEIQISFFVLVGGILSVTNTLASMLLAPTCTNGSCSESRRAASLMQSLTLIYFFFTAVLVLNVLITLVNKEYNARGRTNKAWKTVWAEYRTQSIERAERLSRIILQYIPAAEKWFPKEVHDSLTPEQKQAYKGQYHQANSENTKANDMDNHLATNEDGTRTTSTKTATAAKTASAATDSKDTSVETKLKEQESTLKEQFKKQLQQQLEEQQRTFEKQMGHLMGRMASAPKIRK
ncbi:hypothetical protein BG011_009934 [Mortierella polycephala]|uniref:Uncharacterized protein n=1 Tax=Mortierella polycephala TaxID=41804 RepID=A0A9P6PM47_9FUNG|nr:hypothetical protein BG011_009934 [Mortierella polycephala]